VEDKPEVADRPEQRGSAFPPDAPEKISSTAMALTVRKTIPLPPAQTRIDTRENQLGTRHIQDDEQLAGSSRTRAITGP
jgi:hypothetical protein